FLVVVALVSIAVFAPFGGLAGPWLVLSRIVLIPVVAAIAYEGIRLLARIRSTPPGRLLLVPVLATQRLTTREPDDSQMEVAIAALAHPVSRVPPEGGRQRRPCRGARRRDRRPRDAAAARLVTSGAAMSTDVD